MADLQSAPTHTDGCDVLLIQLPAYGEYSPPLGLATLVGYVKSRGFKAKAIDYNIKFFNYAKSQYRHAWKFSEAHSYWDHGKVYEKTIQPLFEKFSLHLVRDILVHKPKFLGFSVIGTNALTTKDAIREIRKHFGDDIRIIIGGPDIDPKSAAEFLNEFNVVCAFQGEAELGLEDLLTSERDLGRADLSQVRGAYYLKDGAVVATPAAMIKDLNSLPYPDFSDFDLDEYAFKERLLPISTSRGCVAKCSFCGETNFMDRFRQMNADRIVGELRNGVEKYGVKTFRFNDSLINGNLKVLDGWLEAVLASGVEIVFGATQARINGRMSDELLRKIARAGGKLMQYGVETGSDRLLKIMRKGITSSEARDVVRRTRAAGVDVQVNIIVGHFEETLRDYWQTLRFIFDVRRDVKYVAVNSYTFDKFSLDNKKVSDVDDKYSERWRMRGNMNNYYAREAKRRLLVGMIKLCGLKLP